MKSYYDDKNVEKCIEILGDVHEGIRKCVKDYYRELEECHKKDNSNAFEYLYGYLIEVTGLLESYVDDMDVVGMELIRESVSSVIKKDASLEDVHKFFGAFKEMHGEENNEKR